MSSFIPVSTPELFTDRLILRTWHPDEITAVLDGTRLPHWADDFPAEGDHVIAGLCGDHPAWLGEYGHRQIIERAGGLVIGSIGLFWPPTGGTIEIGYGIVPSRRGRGHATEATRRLTEFAFTAPGVHTVKAGVELSNPSSIRVLEKAGYRRSSTDAAQNTATYTATPPSRK
ncbi:GNAT family N-acetyltransferase [Actinomadura fibrosa]|uniref:GNAT family N-acetyltransferase n=1 Tax=Actinomadura fibrosa TaxID=111802 RepID=A0ABW2Y0P6_9ACTN|nr:GNAT family protein [Actinomadura fibrosa]